MKFENHANKIVDVGVPIISLAVDTAHVTTWNRTHYVYSKGLQFRRRVLSVAISSVLPRPEYKIRVKVLYLCADSPL